MINLKENREKLLKGLLKLYPFILFICYIFIHWINIIKSNEFTVLSVIPEVVSLSVPLFVGLFLVVDKLLWKRILLFSKDKKILWVYMKKFETPILKEEYDCLIKYQWNGKWQQKNAKLKVKQDFTSISINIVTDEIESNTIISDIKFERHKYTLYYIYETNPRAKFKENNPVQLGGCKISLDSIEEPNANQELRGKYWTTSRTMGDIELY